MVLGLDVGSQYPHRRMDTGYADDELLIFAVVSEVPKDKSRVPVKASVNDVAMDTKLLASDAILNNLVWKKIGNLSCDARRGHQSA